MPKAKNEGPIPAPFTIQIDTREQRPYAFNAIRANADKAYRPMAVAVIRGCLVHGDYSLVGLGLLLGVERKSKDDLFGSVSRRENFEKRLSAMHEARIKNGFPNTYFCVIVESELSDILHNPPAHSKLNPKSLNRTILAWRQRYAVDWHFLPNREYAEQTTYRILERFFLDHPDTPCDVQPRDDQTILGKSLQTSQA